MNQSSNTTTSSSTVSIQSLLHIISSEHDQICVVSSVGTLCIVINLGALWALRKRRGPPSNFSLFNLFTSSFIATFCAILKLLKDNSTLVITSTFLCRGWGFLLRLSQVLISFSTIGLFYEVTHAKGIEQSKLLKLKVFFAVWTSSFLLSFPGIDTYRMRKRETQQILHGSSFDHCGKVYLLDSKTLYIVYQGIFTTSSLLPAIYTLIALHHLRFRPQLLFICQRVPRGLRRKVRKIRWAFFYSVFICFTSMFPLLFFLMQLNGKLGWRESSKSVRKTNLEMFRQCVFVTQMGLHPLFCLYGHHQLSLWEWLSGFPIISCFCNKNCGRNVKNMDSMRELSVYNMETFALTSHANNFKT